VAMQNQVGQHKCKWDRTGVITEVLPNRQYRILIDGSRRLTLRNRRFLRKISPVTRIVTNDHTDIHVRKPSIECIPKSTTPSDESSPTDVIPNISKSMTQAKDSTKTLDHPDKSFTVAIPEIKNFTTPPVEDSGNAIRRSARIRTMPAKYRDFVLN